MSATQTQMYNRAVVLVALESGEWKQTSGCLTREGEDSYSFCCLGVAEACVRDGEVQHGGLLTGYGQRMLGLSIPDPLVRYKGHTFSASQLNDTFRWTFKQIAKALRPNLMNPNYDGTNPS